MKKNDDEEDFLLRLVKKFRYPVITEAYLQKAKARLEKGDIKLAILSLERLLEIEPNNVEGLKLLEECRKIEVPTKRAIIEIIRHIKEVADKGISEIVEIGEFIQGTPYFNFIPAPVPSMPSTERAIETEIEKKPKSKILESKDFSVTVTPDLENLKLIVTFTSDQFIVKSLKAVLKQEDTLLEGEIAHDSPYLKEIVFDVPKGKSLLEVFD